MNFNFEFASKKNKKEENKTEGEKNKEKKTEDEVSKESKEGEMEGEVGKEKKEKKEKREKLSWREKMREIATNPELYKQIFKTSINSAASIVGLKSFYTVPEYIYERYQVRGIKKNQDGLALDGLSGSVKNLIDSTQKDIDKEDFHESLKDFHKRLNLTKEGVKKGSLQRQELAKVLKEYRYNKDKVKNEEENDRDEKEKNKLEGEDKDKKKDEDKIYERMKTILDDYTTTKVTGVLALKESLNSVLTFSGAFGFRGVVYTALEAVERKNKLEKENRQEKKDEKVSWWKDVIKGGVLETFKDASFKNNKEESKTKRVFKAVKSYGHIARFIGIGSTAAFSPDNYSEGVDKLLDTLSGDMSTEEIIENIGSKADVFNLKDNKGVESENIESKVEDLSGKQESILNRNIDISANSLTEYEMSQLNSFDLADNLGIDDNVIDVLNSDIDSSVKSTLLKNPSLIDFYLNSNLDPDLKNEIINDEKIDALEEAIIDNKNLSISDKEELLEEKNYNNIDELNELIGEKTAIKISIEEGSNFNLTLKKALDNAPDETKDKVIGKIADLLNTNFEDVNDGNRDEVLNQAINVLSTKTDVLPDEKVSDLVYEGDEISVNPETGDWNLIRNNNFENQEEVENMKFKDIKDTEEVEKIKFRESGDLTSNEEIKFKDVKNTEELEKMKFRESGDLASDIEKDNGILEEGESVERVDKAEEVNQERENIEKVEKMKFRESGDLSSDIEHSDAVSSSEQNLQTNEITKIEYKEDVIIINDTTIPKVFSDNIFKEQTPSEYQEILEKWSNLNENDKQWYLDFNDNFDSYQKTQDYEYKASLLKKLLKLEDINFENNNGVLIAEFKGNNIIAGNNSLIINNGDPIKINAENLIKSKDILNVERSDVVDQIENIEEAYEKEENNLESVEDKVDVSGKEGEDLNERIEFLENDFKQQINSSLELRAGAKEFFENNLLDKIKNNELEVPENGYIVLVDRSSNRQTMSLFHFNEEKESLSLIGNDVVSTANPLRYEGAETPLGVHYINRVGEAEVWGKPYGDPGHEVYDLSEGSGIAFHPTNEEKLLGTQASHGCVRMSDQLNDYLDKHNILDVNSPVVIVESSASDDAYVQRNDL